MAEIARRYKVHANVVYKWKRQLLDNAAQSFETDHSDGGASATCCSRRSASSRWNAIFCPTGSGDPDDAATSPDGTVDGRALRCGGLALARIDCIFLTGSVGTVRGLCLVERRVRRDVRPQFAYGTAFAGVLGSDRLSTT